MIEMIFKSSMEKVTLVHARRKKINLPNTRRKQRSTFPKRRSKNFFRKKKGNTKSSRCYVCRKKGHFAKVCPDQEKSSRLIEKISQVEDIKDDDLESLFSLDEEPGPDTILALGADLSDSSDESEDDVILFDEIYTLTPAESLLLQPTPSAKVHIFPGKWDKPILVIAFFDTGASSSIMKPEILPKEYWNTCYKSFRAANGDTFVIFLISKPIRHSTISRIHGQASDLWI